MLVLQTLLVLPLQVLLLVLLEALLLLTLQVLLLVTLLLLPSSPSGARRKPCNFDLGRQALLPQATAQLDE